MIMSPQKIIVTGITGWDAWVEANAEALISMYDAADLDEAEEQAFYQCVENGLVIGGGAAPEFHISFADENRSQT